MVQFLSRLFPARTERPLSELLSEQAQLLVQAADTHSKLLGNSFRERTRIAPTLHEQSTVAEELSRRTARRLAESLITPYEAELLYDFSLTIADLVDSMEHTAELLVISQAGALPTPLLDAAKGIERAAELTVAASWKLNDTQDLGDYYIQVRKLKRQGDRLVRQALGELYGRGGSTQELLPLHDVARSVQHTIALQERVARITDLLRIKDA